MTKLLASIALTTALLFSTPAQSATYDDMYAYLYQNKVSFIAVLDENQLPTSVIVINLDQTPVAVQNYVTDLAEMLNVQLVVVNGVKLPAAPAQSSNTQTT